MFEKASLLRRLRHSYVDEPLARKLQVELDNALKFMSKEGQAHAVLGDPGLRSLLMMVLRNHTTDSPWPVSNNPYAKYNQRKRADGSPRVDCISTCRCGNWCVPAPPRRPFFRPRW